MPTGAVCILLACAMFPALILTALVVKLWEIHKARSWPSTEGRVIASGVQAHKKKPSDPGYGFSDTEVSNEPRVEYEYQIDGKKYRCQRISIGEKTSGDELEAILERYPVGAAVTVYYDPAKPQTAVLERDLPAGKIWMGVGCLLLVFIGGPLLATFLYFNSVDWLTSHLKNPGRAPFVAAAGGFGVLVSLFGLAFWRFVRQAANWPVTSGRIIAAEVESYHDLRAHEAGYGRTRRFYKPSVVYRYEVNGRHYTGDRLTLGLTFSATLPGVAQRTANQYPVGTEVEVHYNPLSPGESVLHPHSSWHYVIGLIAAVMFTLAWAVATGRI